MREILFRGKISDEGWIYGSLDLSRQIGYPSVIRVYNTNEYRSVIPKSVGQYIGILDANGTRIFKDDILKITGVNRSGIFVVIWDDYRLAWWAKNIKIRDLVYKDDYFQLLNCSFQQSRLKVIGNIHDNTELLNQ